MAWTVYATSWRDNAILDELPASDIEYTLEVSSHGEASFFLPVPRGGAPWLPLVRPSLTGILIAEDDQVRWGGQVVTRQRSDERGYRVTCREWGSAWEEQFFSAFMSFPDGFTGMDRSRVVESIARAAVKRKGTDWPLEVEAVDCGQTVDVLEDVRETALKSVMSVIQDVCDPEGAPEWRLSVEGPVWAPRRVLRVGPHLGRATVEASQIMLDYVADYETPAAVRQVRRAQTPSVLGNLYPTSEEQDRFGKLGRARRHGGNVITDPGDDMTAAGSATRVFTTAEVTERDTTDSPGIATADRLIDAGYPLREVIVQTGEAPSQADRDRHAAGALNARLGFLTTWKFSTFAGDPSLAEFQPGDQAAVSVESDLYGYAGPGRDPEPLRFEARLTGCSVKPDDNASKSSAVVNYTAVVPAGVLGY